VLNIQWGIFLCWQLPRFCDARPTIEDLHGLSFAVGVDHTVDRGHAPYFWNWGTTQIMFFAPPLTFGSEKLVFFRCAPIVVRLERCQFNLRLKLITSEAKNIWHNDQKEFKTLHVLWVLLLTAVIVGLCFGRPVYATVHCRRPSVSRRRGTNMELFANRSDVV